jgi:pyruvate ferredoxin oxidoreductase alpha subunit
MATAPTVDIYAREDLLTGCQAVAEGVRLADVDVVAAYPIRPYTEVMDNLSKLIADGALDAEYIVADSEHSQFEIVKHASAVGARAFAGSSGTGWLYGFEALVVTATDRLPVLYLVGNRALDDPGAFGVEHNDALALRDMGWLLCWATTAQEALEHVLIGYRVAEDARVRMPMALAVDGAFLTHSQHIVQVPSPDAVRRFLPNFDAGERRLHPDNPISVAPQVNEDWVMEIRRQNSAAALRAKAVIKEAYAEFGGIFGPRYDSPFFTPYMVDDAEAVMIGLGTVAMPAMAAVDRLRSSGERVGYINLRWFRPFPTEELRSAMGNARAVGVIDRDFAHGAPDGGGILFHDIRSCLYPLSQPPVAVNFIAGLGGRDISIDETTAMFEQTLAAGRSPRREPEVHWVGVRGSTEE